MLKIISIILGLFIAIGAISFIFNYKKNIVIQTNTNTQQTDSVSAAPHDNLLLFDHERAEENAFIQSISQRLKQQHGHEIHLISVQISMQDFRNFIREDYPNNSQEIFTTIMHLAFPKYAEAILSLIQKLDQYEAWYAANLLNLNDMDPLTKKEETWNKRREIFGDLAEQIWQKEINNDEQKRQTVQQTISQLDNAHDITMQERLYILQNTLSEQYPQEQNHFAMNKGLISNVYFQLDSVQADLKNMSPEQRSQALAESRKQLGFSSNDIDRLAKEDKQKEQRWQNGHQYMSARKRLEQTYDGDEFTEKLTALREEYFKHEAPTISAEEASGFYRYNRPRLYGSN